MLKYLLIILFFLKLWQGLQLLIVHQC